jgi:antitoxin MazE
MVSSPENLDKYRSRIVCSLLYSIKGVAIMKVKIQQWGHSLGIRIPKAYAHDACLRKGSVVDITKAKGKIVIMPAEEPEFSLKELLSGITSKNIHHEVDTGTPSGKEVW